MRLLLFFWLNSLLFSVPAHGQKLLKFSELLTFSYGKGSPKKETSVYLDRKTSTWLFTNDDSFGGTAEGVAYVVAYANGTYLSCGPDELGTISCLRHRATAFRTTTVPGKPTGPAKRFGQNKYGWPTFLATPVALQAGRLTQTTYLAAVPFNCTPLYAYNALLSIENYLPVFRKVNYAQLLLPKQLVLREETPDGATFQSLSPTEYVIDLRRVKIIDAPR